MTSNDENKFYPRYLRLPSFGGRQESGQGEKRTDILYSMGEKRGKLAN
jgi:hypothetical protein